MRLPRSLAAAVLGVAAACSFFDPLDQKGLRVAVFPHDTAVYVGHEYRVHGMMINSYVDVYPSEHIEFAGLDANATVAADGTVRGAALGRARVVARRGDLADTGWVSVVPVGTLGLSFISDQSRVDIVGVDGSVLLSPVPSGQVNGGAPAWLPGNAGFVFQYAIPGGAGATRLFVSDLAGSTRLLVDAGSNARVARDGSWVYYDVGTTLWRIHVDGTGAERVTTGPDAHPDPSPDGTRLAFVRHEFPGDFFQLAVRVLATGADTVFGPEGFYPRWAPSGDTIAYWAGDQFAREGAIWVLAADGSGARQVSAVGRTYHPVGLDWSPDGQWLLAREDTTLDLIRVATGLTIPLPYTRDHQFASWRW